MIKKNILAVILLCFFNTALFAQPNILPAKKQDSLTVLLGGTIHTGDGQVIENGYVSFDKGKIVAIGDARVVKFNPNTIKIISTEGKHIYPGLIAPVTFLGLSEFASVRATRDFAETGDINAHVRSIIAYNTDSKVIPTVRSNGILMAQITPQGGLVSGQSSVVQLDAWNWEDAAYKTDMALHINWPVLQTNRRQAVNTEAQKKELEKAIDALTQYFTEAKAYALLQKPDEQNARFGAMKGLFNGSKKLFVNVSTYQDILASVKFFKRFGITPVINGAADAHLAATFLKEQQVPVILTQSQSLPDREDDEVNLPYKQAKLMQDAGVLFGMSVENYWQQRNLPFMAGTTVAYGITKEQALTSVTLNTAKILGIDKTCGSITVGKDATFFVSTGDALDVIGNNVETAFIQGRKLNLDDYHKQLYKKYTEKYGMQ